MPTRPHERPEQTDEAADQAAKHRVSAFTFRIISLLFISHSIRTQPSLLYVLVASANAAERIELELF